MKNKTSFFLLLIVISIAFCSQASEKSQKRKKGAVVKKDFLADAVILGYHGSITSDNNHIYSWTSDRAMAVIQGETVNNRAADEILWSLKSLEIDFTQQEKLTGMLTSIERKVLRQRQVATNDCLNKNSSAAVTMVYFTDTNKIGLCCIGSCRSIIVGKSTGYIPEHCLNSNVKEREAVKSKGGTVEYVNEEYGYRLNHHTYGTSCSRLIGNSNNYNICFLKDSTTPKEPGLSAEPEFWNSELNENHAFVMIGSNHYWRKFSNLQVVSFVRDGLLWIKGSCGTNEINQENVSLLYDRLSQSIEDNGRENAVTFIFFHKNIDKLLSLLPQQEAPKPQPTVNASQKKPTTTDKSTASTPKSAIKETIWTASQTQTSDQPQQQQPKQFTKTKQAPSGWQALSRLGKACAIIGLPLVTVLIVWFFYNKAKQ